MRSLYIDQCHIQCIDRVIGDDGGLIMRSIDGTWTGKTYPFGNAYLFTETQKLFWWVYVDDIEIAGKKQNLALMCKKLMKNVDIEDPTSYLDHVYLGCTQRQCKPDDTIIEQQKKIFESRISAGATGRNFQNGKSHVQKFQRGPTTWKDMLKNAWNRIANWQTRKQSNYIRCPVLAWTTTKWRINIWKTLVNCHKFAHILSWNACTWH